MGKEINLNKRISPFTTIIGPHLDSVPQAFKDQFLYTPEDPYDLILEGVMEEIWHNPRWLRPLFWVMGKLGIFVPYTGRNVQATVTIQAGYDNEGNPYHTFNRHLKFPKPYNFNTIMAYDTKKDHLVEMLGPGGFLYMVWQADFTPQKEFTFKTQAVAIKIGKLKLWLPRWLWIWMGEVSFKQIAISDKDDTSQLEVAVKHPLFDNFFGYRGTFVVKNQKRTTKN